MHRRFAVLMTVALFASLSGCAKLVDLDPERRPCDAAGHCLDGFVCEDGTCVPYRSPCETPCANGERCLASGACVVDDCANKVCAAGAMCTLVDAVPTCMPVAATAFGHPCATDAECTQGVVGSPLICLRGAVQDAATGALAPGLCVEKCGTGATCTTASATCQAFPLGKAGGTGQVCLTPGLATACQSDARCADDGLLCTFFDHPTTGPLGFCTTPLAGGAIYGEACASTPTSTAKLCANGLCTPQSPTSANVPPTCATPCEDGTCPSGVCELVPLKILDAIRRVPVCIPEATQCVPCAVGGLCGSDASLCQKSGADGSQRCLAPCAVATSGGLACPAGFACQPAAEGGTSCAPAAGNLSCG